ncbi:hypothetical protein ASPTUDRAFT_43504 [Aspergillus tubingensis CBS 134.48]|uniref:Uncharacterized protein n=1 Tax=Aspergillus tubingensis (strain CBS 134.48) TaxID=767770 RepID=A0A1L9N5F5_ASPTC|nr:hypothetical protein ASPTUDRAFT_43504 [Aspergillus tubingensis CBS 134.48]
MRWYPGNGGKKTPAEATEKPMERNLVLQTADVRENQLEQRMRDPQSNYRDGKISVELRREAH